MKKDDLTPGQRVSAYHYHCARTGCLYTSKGQERSTDRYVGVCIFVDNASGYVTVKHQVALSAGETVRTKLEFEREDLASGVKVNAYHTDNGVFQADEFMG